MIQVMWLARGIALSYDLDPVEQPLPDRRVPARRLPTDEYRIQAAILPGCQSPR